jgi:hypothetical protein
LEEWQTRPVGIISCRHLTNILEQLLKRLELHDYITWFKYVFCRQNLKFLIQPEKFDNFFMEISLGILNLQTPGMSSLRFLVVSFCLSFLGEHRGANFRIFEPMKIRLRILT